jgi:hypothetical protein
MALACDSLHSYIRVRAARPPMTSGDVFSFSPLVRCKDGRLLRLADRSQFFYDHDGNV